VEHPVLSALDELAKHVDMPAYLLARGYGVAPGCTGRDGIDFVKGDEVVRVGRLDSGPWTFTDPKEPWRSRSMSDFLREREGLPAKEALARIVDLQRRGTRAEVGVAYQRLKTTRPPELQAAEAELAREMSGAKLAERMLERIGVPRASYDEWRFGKLRSSSLETLTREPEGLWGSRSRSADKMLVLVERPIDAVAYESVRGQQECCYLAVGKLTGEQAQKLAHVLGDVRGVKVALAFGATERGQALAERVRAIAPMVAMERHAPPSIGRWAEHQELQQQHSAALKAVQGRRLGVL